MAINDRDVRDRSQSDGLSAESVSLAADIGAKALSSGQLSVEEPCHITEYRPTALIKRSHAKMGRRSVIQSSHSSRRSSRQFKSKPPAGLFAAVVEAEYHLWALALSLYFAVAALYGRRYLILPIVLGPIMLLITMLLTGWVAVFVAAGHLLLKKEPSDGDWLKEAHSPTPFEDKRNQPFSFDSLYKMN